jgi:hypothetical protein
MRDSEALSPDEVWKYTQLLMKLFDVLPIEILDDDFASSNLLMTVNVNVLGLAHKQTDPMISPALRGKFGAVGNMVPYYIDSTKPDWTTAGEHPYFTGSVAPIELESYEGASFILEEHNMQGFAATGLDSGEVIWQIPSTSLAFVIQPPGPDRTAAIIGLAIVFALNNRGNITTVDVALDEQPEYVSNQKALPCKQSLTLNLHALMTLFEVAQVANRITAMTSRQISILARERWWRFNDASICYLIQRKAIRIERCHSDSTLGGAMAPRQSAARSNSMDW